MKVSLKKLLPICLLLGILDFCEAVQTSISKKGRRPPIISNRSVFTVVRFLNVPCSSASGYLTGTCFSLSDCVKMQGQQIGSCASGFGVCCIFQRTCGVTINKNATHFTNPGYPQAITESEDTSCTLTLIRPHHKGPICQIRLDFLEFQLARPTDGSCVNDKFSVLGNNLNAPVPELCGQNPGQHMYIDVGNSIGPVFLTVNTKGMASRKWNIKTSFIECSSPYKAPSSCLQYYTGIQGRFSSFNYVPGQTAVSTGGYFNNMDYAVCFRKEVGRCSQTYTAENIESFNILNLNPETNSPTVGSGEAGLGIAECPMDYLRIGGDRFCGARLNPSTESNANTNAPVTDNSNGPFIAYFKTDSANNAIGFNLQYIQNPCG